MQPLFSRILDNSGFMTSFLIFSILEKYSCNIIIWDSVMVCTKKPPGKAGRTDYISLCLSGSSDRAGAGAGAAFDALFRIDFELSVTFGNGFNGAFGCTSAASDAFV